MPAPPDRAASPHAQALLDTIKRDFPACAQPMLTAGVRRQLEFQDAAYAQDYLRRMKTLRDLDAQHGGDAQQWALTCAAARYVATAMAYDDVIRVADLKTRGTRFDRVRQEVGARPDQLVYLTEFMHPRLEEICGTLPSGLGRWLEGSKTFSGFVERRLGKGRRMQSGTLGGFLMLYTLAGMRRFRRSTLRHKIEMDGLEHWLDLIARLTPQDYALAVETVNCRRLVKGYSDTHVRGGGKYRQLIAAAAQLAGRPDAAATLRELRNTALANEKCGPMERQLADKLAA